MQLRNASRLLSVSVLGLGGLVSTNAVFAAGFALRNHSASGVGTSLASDTVNTFDASGLLSNPAIMSQFKGNHLSLNINYTAAGINAKDAKATPYAAVTGASYAATQGPSSVDDISDPVTVPSIAAIFQVTDDVHAGFTFNVPYGTNTEYNNEWAGRYHAIKTELKTFDVGLHLSYKVSDMLAVGVSADWQKAEGELSQASDLGLISYAGAGAAARRYQAAAQQAAAAAQTAQANGDAAAAQQYAAAAQQAAGAAQQAGAAATQAFPLIGRADAITTYKGDSTSYGWGLGLFFKPVEGTRVGFSFKGSIRHTAKGDLTWGPTNNFSTQLLAGLAATDSRFKNSDDADLSLKLPTVTSLGLAQDLSDFTVYANVTLTQWNSFNDLSPEFAGTRSVTELFWKNSLYYAVGADYRLAPEWTLRAGLGFDQSATDTKHRTPRTPDNDRVALSIGASYVYGAFNVTAAYQKLFVDDAKVDLKAADYPDNNTRGDLTANLEIDPSIGVVSVGYGF
jgi:long-chain fatty acid transport protein